MTSTQSPQDFLPLTPPVFHILLALADEERHGYGIMQDVARQTAEALQLGPGTLYGCLKRMPPAPATVTAPEPTAIRAWFAARYTAEPIGCPPQFVTAGTRSASPRPPLRQGFGVTAGIGCTPLLGKPAPSGLVAGRRRRAVL